MEIEGKSGNSKLLLVIDPQVDFVTGSLPVKGAVDDMYRIANHIATGDYDHIIVSLDWHNYGYTILQCNGRNKLICYIAKLYEHLYGHSSHINFCVSDAMKKNLKDMFNIDAITLPDQAMRNVFKRLNLEEAHTVFQKYEEYK